MSQRYEKMLGRVKTLTQYCPTGTFVPLCLKFQFWKKWILEKNPYEHRAYESVGAYLWLYLKIWRLIWNLTYLNGFKNLTHLNGLRKESSTAESKALEKRENLR